MLSIVERVIILQSVDVFSEVPVEQLAHVAAIATEVSVEQGQVLFRQDDASDAMYVVLEGRIRLARGAQVVTVAGQDEAFGTWSLFDEDPRVVEATADEDSQLLQVARADFVDLLADNVEITQGVLKGIVMRLKGLAGRVNLDKAR